MAGTLFVVFALMFALFLILIQFLQAILGYTALHAATGLLPMAVMMMPLSTVAPTIAHKIGYRRTVVTGMLTLAAGLALAGVVISNVPAAPGLAEQTSPAVIEARTRLPVLADVPYPVQMEPNLVVEFYSR